MPFLYITEQGAYIRRKGPHIEVVKNEEVIADLALRDVTGLVTFGGVHPTTEALLALLDAGADIAFMTQNGHFKGRLVSATGKNSILRAQQYAALSDPGRKLEMARYYVAAKIRNGSDVLYDYHRNANNPFEFGNRQRLEEFAGKALVAENVESLRGYEGAAAKLYFANFAKCLLHDRVFPGRIFHPSTDPINALLSFGYSFVAREIQAMLDALGLDPYIGFFHDITYGRASLSLDLMEEFRHPVVDRLALRLFNKKMLGDDDFEKSGSDGQVYLKKESLKIFVHHYEEWANEKNRTWMDDREMSWRQAIWKQGEKLRHAIETGGNYKPFSWKEVAG
jgi:CRISPR-associated protein Cas1